MNMGYICLYPFFELLLKWGDRQWNYGMHIEMTELAGCYLVRGEAIPDGLFHLVSEVIVSMKMARHY